MIRPHRTRDPVAQADSVLVYGTVWINHTRPRPVNPLHPAAVAAAERRVRRAAKRAAVYARAAKA